MRFLVKNRNDIIQRYDYRGTFYEPEELAIMADAIQPGSVIADIGSNVGNHTVYFDKFLAAREVILFEVNPDAIAILLVNQALNNCTSWNTSYLRYAASNKFAAIKKFPARDNNLGGTQFRTAEDGEFRSIVGDVALANKPVDFIKIDVEGGEMAVLTGLQETVRRWQPSMFVEVGPRSADPFKAFCQAHGYVIKTEFNRHAPFFNYLIVPSRRSAAA